MAHNQLQREKFCCSICLDLLKDPVTTPCGHNYCRNCIQRHWDVETEKKVYCCPQCRQTFRPRPVLGKNTMLADLVDDLKKTGLQTASAAKRIERQREPGVSQQNIQQRIHNRESEVKLLQKEVEAINHSADKAVDDSEKMFTELTRLMRKRRSDVKQQVRSQQETEVGRVRELQEKLEQEITELKRLSHTEDHNQFLQDHISLSGLSESTQSSSISSRPLRYFEDVTAAVTEIGEKLQDVLREMSTKVLQTVAEVDVLLSQSEPETRHDFLKYSQTITLDPNTAHNLLLLSTGNRKATLMREQQFYSSHPERFTEWNQVLSRESLTGRCYWEVEWRGGVCVAVAYKNSNRSGGWDKFLFGCNDKSWALNCDTKSYDFWYNNVHTHVSGPRSSRVGVYLDHRAGILSFYTISEYMTLLHRVQTTFTQPLHAGLRFYFSSLDLSDGSTAEFCELR